MAREGAMVCILLSLILCCSDTGGSEAADGPVAGPRAPTEKPQDELVDMPSRRTCPGDPGRSLTRRDEPSEQSSQGSTRGRSLRSAESGVATDASPSPAAGADTALDAAAGPARPGGELSPRSARLRDEIRRCLAFYYHHRPEKNTDRGPWGVMHAIVGFGVDTRLLVNDQDMNAIGWLCWNQPCYDLRLFSTQRGQLIVNQGLGYQGHEGQFLMIMAWSRVPKTYGLKVDGRDFTIEDVIRFEQRSCRADSELSFKLLALVHYLGTDATWQNQEGQDWSIERMLREELKQPVIGAACGGIHRLEGFGYSVRKRLTRNEPITGQWVRAKKYVEDYVDYTYKLQNEDGSFSTNWFKGRENADDLDLKLNTTGHTTEWLLLSLPDDRLADPRLERAVMYLRNLLWNDRDREWEVGPKGHALHSLVLYDERVFGGKPGPQRMAEFARILDASRLR